MATNHRYPINRSTADVSYGSWLCKNSNALDDDSRNAPPAFAAVYVVHLICAYFSYVAETAVTVR
jgi:hypothetical protein